MSFIAKNPLTIPEVDNSPSVPKSGTRGLFAGKDGWYDVDSSGKITKLGSNGESNVSGDKEILTVLVNIKNDVITFDKTFEEFKEAYNNGLVVVLNFEGTVTFPNINYDNEDETFYIEVCKGDTFWAFLFYESGAIEELIEREHVSKEEFEMALGEKAEQSDLEDLRTETEDLQNQISNQEVFTVYTESTTVGNGLSVVAMVYDDILDAYNSGKIIRFGMEDGFYVYPLVKFNRTENSLYFQYWKDNTWYAYRLRDDSFEATISMEQVDCITAMDAKSLNSKSDKTTIITSDEVISTLEMEYNQEVRYGEMEYLELTITVDSIDDLSDDFISSVVFTSGDVPANFVYDAELKVSGEDCVDGVFVPVANKRYTIIISYDGVYLTGIVGGVSI